MCVSKSVLCMVILSMCSICSYPVLVSTGMSPGKKSQVSCEHALENQRDSEHAKSIVQKCLKLYPLKDPNDSGSIEDSQRIFEENQSNCALKCVNENFNVTKEDGLIDVLKIQQIFLDKVNVSSPYVLKLTSLMNECERKAAEQIEKEAGGLEENSCKYHVLFIHCYSDAYVASRQEIYKLCQESAKTEKQN